MVQTLVAWEAFHHPKLSPDDSFTDIINKIMKKTIHAMKKNNTPFVGFLYAGLMIEKDTQKPYVLEYNVRMGDPECQPIMMRMKSDLFDYIKVFNIWNFAYFTSS